jgi:hypothetical protein
MGQRIRDQIVVTKDDKAYQERRRTIAQQIVIRGEDGNAVLCPFCGSPLNVDEQYICPECEIGHHLECWEQNGGCTTVGCVRAVT